MINAPVLVLTAAGLSVIAKGGITKDTPVSAADAVNANFKFWASILFAAGGIIFIDRWNSQLAQGMGALWIVGTILSNGGTIADWLKSFGKGVK